MKQAMIDYVKKPKVDHYNTPEYAVRPLLPYLRVEFSEGSVWFNTSWFCYGLLPRQLIFTELQKE